MFKKLDYNLYPFNNWVNTFKAYTSADYQLAPWKNKAKSNLLESVKFLTSPPLYSEAGLSTVLAPSAEGMKDNFY